jgi:hypothetical protein
MEISVIHRILRDNFTLYSSADYKDFYYYKPRKCGKYYHNEADFHIVVFDDDNSVYQLNTDHEIFGVELKTFPAFKKRFESFTGKKYKIDYRMVQR